METLIVTGAAGSIGTRVCKTLAETDGIDAILGIDTRPEMPNHRRIYHHQTDLRHEDLKLIFEGATTLVHLATSFGPSSDGVDAGGDEIDATHESLKQPQPPASNASSFCHQQWCMEHGPTTLFQ